jgi:hypothetical protein
MNDDIRTLMTVHFVAQHVDLTPVELARGYRLRFLDDAGVVLLAEQSISKGASEDPALDALALLLSDELDRVDRLVSEIEQRHGGDHIDASRVWLYLALLLAFERRDVCTDPLSAVEQVYADFGYPEEIEGFVPFLPAPEGQTRGREGIEARWSAYLRARDHEFRQRRSGE